MKARDLLKQLVEDYGAIVNTEHHVQVPSKTGKHDVWFTKTGLKWRLHGNRDTDCGSPAQLIGQLSRYKPESSDLGWARSLTAFIRKLEGRSGVYADAGWKAGIAQIAVVRITDDEMDVKSKRIKVGNINQAETAAVELAQSLWPGETVYTDSQIAANGTGATWIPRNQNKVADRFGNRRG